MTPVIAQKNSLILQGRALCEKPQDAEMSVVEWFGHYKQLKDQFRGEQVRIIAIYVLILQGRLLCEKPQGAEMTIAEWFELHEEYKEGLHGEQERVIGSLAVKLMQIQFATQLQNAKTAIVF